MFSENIVTFQTIKPSLFYRENGWIYTCVDLFVKFTESWPSETITSFVLIEARVQENSDTTVDYFVDNINIGSQKTVEDTGMVNMFIS